MSSLSSRLVSWSRSPWGDVTAAASLLALGILLHFSGTTGVVAPLIAVLPAEANLVLLALAFLIQTQRRRFPILMLFGSLVLFVASGFLGFTTSMLLVLMDGLFVATLYTGERTSRRVVQVNVVLVALLMVAALTFVPGVQQATQAAIGVLAVTVLPIWWALQVRHHRSAAANERERADQQARLAELDRRAALAEERGRMARDLHDVISGHVSAIAIQSEAALQLADGGDRETVRRVLHSVRENSVAALTEMRAMITLLRSEDAAQQDERTAAHRLRDLDQLVDSARAGGLSVRVDEQSGADLPAAVDLAAYRIVQEALTNVTKHAAGSRTAVTLSRQDGSLVIQVTNDLTGPVRNGGTGTGLLSMTERAQAVGGWLAAGREADTWRVRAVLPTEVATA